MAITRLFQQFSEWVCTCRLWLMVSQLFQGPETSTTTNIELTEAAAQPVLLGPETSTTTNIEVPEAADQLGPETNTTTNIEVPEAAAQLGPETSTTTNIVGIANMDWGTITVGFCLSSAVGLALSSNPPSPTTSFHTFSFVISLSFASIIVSHFIRYKFPVIARMLYEIGIFFVVTAFFIAITIHSPMYLKLITWLIYALSFFGIFVSKFVRNDTAST